MTVLRNDAFWTKLLSPHRQRLLSTLTLFELSRPDRRCWCGVSHLCAFEDKSEELLCNARDVIASISFVFSRNATRQLRLLVEVGRARQKKLDRGREGSNFVQKASLRKTVTRHSKSLPSFQMTATAAAAGVESGSDVTRELEEEVRRLRRDNKQLQDFFLRRSRRTSSSNSRVTSLPLSTSAAAAACRCHLKGRKRFGMSRDGFTE